MALNGSKGQDLTMVLGGITRYVRLFLTTLESPFLALHCAHILLLFLFHFPTTYLLLLVSPGVSGFISGMVSGSHTVWQRSRNGLRDPCCVAGVISGVVLAIV